MIRLGKQEIDFMVDILDIPADICSRLLLARAIGGGISDADADALRDLCGERLQSHGFGPGYEPTEEGRKLEEMIDRLFVG